ncbi:MAG: DUF393 domain-containing protein [Actinomycetota bacterium]|nr:DUF393 domain-containing protein [Actinomycetota bacterium]
MSRVLLYDGNCGFCTASAGWVHRLGCQVETIPWQSWPRLAEHGLTPEMADRVVHLVDGERLLVGHEAIAGTLARSRYFPVRLAGRAVGSSVVRPLAKRVYATVARNRSRLPGSTASG